MVLMGFPTPVHTIAGINLPRGPTQPPQARVAMGRRLRKAGDTHARRLSPAGDRPHAVAPAVSGDFSRVDRVRSTLSNLQSITVDYPIWALQTFET